MRGGVGRSLELGCLQAGLVLRWPDPWHGELVLRPLPAHGPPLAALFGLLQDTERLWQEDTWQLASVLQDTYKHVVLGRSNKLLLKHQHIHFIPLSSSHSCLPGCFSHYSAGTFL